MTGYVVALRDFRLLLSEFDDALFDGKMIFELLDVGEATLGFEIWCDQVCEPPIQLDALTFERVFAIAEGLNALGYGADLWDCVSQQERLLVPDPIAWKASACVSAQLAAASASDGRRSWLEKLSFSFQERLGAPRK